MNTTLPLAATKWTIDSNQSDVLIKARHSIIAYIAGSINKFKGHIDIHEDAIEDASIEFCLDVNNKDTKLEQMDTHLRLNDFLDINEFPFINFKSTSFQKINNNINFLKGELTIHNITKVVELDAEFIGIRTYEGVEKAVFEVVGNINRKDFGLTSISNNQTGGLSLGQDIKLIANLEFSV
jgi:polyisoprenoid-binding protein YceI